MGVAPDRSSAQTDSLPRVGDLHGPVDTAAPAPANPFEAEVAKWTEPRQVRSRWFEDWVPPEVRADILGGKLPEGLTKYPAALDTEVVVSISRQGGDRVVEMYQTYPEDRRFYLELTRGDADKARRLHGAMSSWNRDMRHFVEAKGESPGDARREIRRINGQVFKLVVEGAAMIMTSGAASASLMRAAAGGALRPPSPRAGGRPRGPAATAPSRPSLDTGNIVSHPRSLWGRTADEIAAAFNKAGFKASVRKSTRGSRRAQIVKIDGHPEISQIQVHPGGGRHRGAYYKLSTSTQGKIKVVDPGTYQATPGEKAKIISHPR